MKFSDPVYGTVAVDHPVLQDLTETQPVQRLKHVHQSGPTPFFMDKAAVTRFQHSRGVMALLNRFDAPVEEQIAGLLHDVPHTAFSHVADFVFPNEEHEYHEQFLEKIVYDSEIPTILDQYGFDPDRVLDDSGFGLLERDLPDLCGDRIDYFLRDMQVVAGKNMVQLLNALAVRDGRFVLTDPSAAEQYALQYIEADNRFWANPKEVAIYDLFADAVRRALDTGLLSENDLFGTDNEVYTTLTEADDELIQEQLALLQNGFEIEPDADDPDLTVSTKVRYVDPLVVTDEERYRISERSDTVRAAITEHEEDVGSGYRLRIIT